MEGEKQKMVKLPQYKARKTKKSESLLRDTDIIEPGVEIWISDKWVRVPRNSVVMGATVGHIKMIEEDSKYRYEECFKEDKDFWESLRK